MNKIVLQKKIDISALTTGVTIPRSTTDIFGFFGGSYLNPGESKTITIIFNNKPYQVQVQNVHYSKKSRETHPNDAIQIRYSKQSNFAKALKTVFNISWEYLSKEKERRYREEDHKRVFIPNTIKEYLVLYSTEKEDVFTAEPILSSDMQDLKTLLSLYPEQQIESLLENDITDSTAGYKEQPGFKKIRKLKASIASRLKGLYEYRCQICGELAGSQYGVHTCECHHIDYFSKSLNNNMSNQLIVCPNHHRAIHSANPNFNRKLLQYEFKNGFTEKLKLNKHLTT